ncbi:MAG: mechanosensitive ion channel, partial [Phycisphaerae bacterium]|nr:mechanosensitive ion channel [Phycisphaerae bacterium]
LVREVRAEVDEKALAALSSSARAELLARLVADAAAQREKSDRLRAEGDRIASQVADVQTQQLALKKQRDAATDPVELEQINASLEQIERLIDQRRLLGYEIARQARAEERLAYEYEQAAAAIREYAQRFWVQNRWLVEVGRILAYALLATLATHLLARVITATVGVTMRYLRGGTALPTVKRTQTLVQFARSIALLVIWVAATVSVLAEFGVSPGQSAGALGVIGLVLAGMFQQLVVDFVKGIDIAVGGHYYVGDFIQVGNYSGHVLDFTAKYTVLRTPSGQVVTLPNSQCVPSRRFPAGFVDNYVDIVLARPADLARARARLDDVARLLNRRIEAVKQGPLIEREFVDGQVAVLRVLVRVLPACDWVITERYIPEVKRALADAGIELAGEPTFFYLNDVKTFRRLFSRQMTDKDMAAAVDADLRPTIERDALPDAETEAAEAAEMRHTSDTPPPHTTEHQA